MNPLFQYNFIDKTRKFPVRWEEKAYNELLHRVNANYISKKLGRSPDRENGYCFRYGHRTMKALL